MAITEADVIHALKGVKDPDLGKDLTDLGMIKDIRVMPGKVSLTVELTTPACPLKDAIGADVKQAVTTRLAGISSCDITFTSSVRSSMPTGSALLPTVKNVILVGSGKGGVGKSTISSNLACALAQTGARVGIMDADVYGPSLPTLFGTKGERPEATEDQRIVPITKFGMKLMSMGMLLEEGQPVVWRGPMLDGAMKQFLGQVAWGDLDYLVIDLPPGTGDVQLSLSRMVPQAFAVIVTTPQDIALADVRRAFNMFKQVNIQPIGVVENMSGFVCGHCGERTDIFLSGGGKKAAMQFGVELLGEIPLTSDTAMMTDSGVPAVIQAPDGAFGKVMRAITGKIAQIVAVESSKRGNAAAGAGAVGGAMPVGGMMAAAPQSNGGHGHAGHSHGHDHGHSHAGHTHGGHSHAPQQNDGHMPIRMGGGQPQRPAQPSPQPQPSRGDGFSRF
jgi:ATP-binding protein involved in chromosome partitioning